MKMGDHERARITQDINVLAMAWELHKKLYERAEAIIDAIDHENRNGRETEVLAHHLRTLEDVLEAIEAARPALGEQMKKSREKHKAHVSKITE
jgi:hypothetical protein